MRGWPIDSSLLISSFYLLCYNVIRPTSLKITLSLCFLFGFLHSRIPCQHNAWVADNCLDLFICLLNPLQPSKISLTSPKNHTSTFLYYLLFVKMGFYFFTLRKTGLAKTIAAGPFLPALCVEPSVLMFEHATAFDLCIYSRWV